MVEFGTSAELEVQVSPSSLRSARNEIESELGDVTVDVSSTTGGGSSVAGRDRARQRQLITQTNDHLAGIGSSWDENLELNSERNDLLRELIDVNETSAQTTRGGGRGLAGGMMMGAVGLAAGGVGLGAMLFEGIADNIGDLVDNIELNPSDVVAPAAVAAADLVDSGVDLVAEDVVEPVALTVGDVVDSEVELSATDVAIAATIGPAAVIASKAAITAGDVIDSAATLGPADVVVAATLTPSAVIASKVALEATDIIDGAISASDILEAVTEGAAEAAPSGGGDGVGIGEMLGIGGAGLAGGLTAQTLWQTIQSGGSAAAQAGARGAGAAAPVFTPGMFREDMSGLEGTIFDERHPLQQRGEPVQAGRETRTDRAPMLDEQYQPGGEATVENQNRVEINADLGSLERDVRDGLSELERRVEEVERAFR